MEGAVIPTRSNGKADAPRGTDEHGLTLVETLVSVLLLAFVALGSASLLTTTLHQNKLAQKRSLATHLAAERIEHLNSKGYESSTTYAAYRLLNEVADDGPPITLTAGYGSIVGHPEFRRVVTLNYGVPVPGMLQVISEVYWSDLKQGEKRHVMVTYVHPGLERAQ